MQANLRQADDRHRATLSNVHSDARLAQESHAYKRLAFGSGDFDWSPRLIPEDKAVIQIDNRLRAISQNHGLYANFRKAETIDDVNWKRKEIAEPGV